MKNYQDKYVRLMYNKNVTTIKCHNAIFVRTLNKNVDHYNKYNNSAKSKLSKL